MSRILVLGAYGLIGSACVRALRRAGHDVTGLGRSEKAAKASGLEIPWIFRDLPSVSNVEWSRILGEFDVVVNASGALQDSARDSVEGIHVTALDHLTDALKDTPLRLIQISAAGVSNTASTRFFRTKAKGDALIAERLSNWVILRPTLVLSPEAYGGTALLRGAAALPFVQPSVFSQSQIQTVHVDDVAHAVLASAEGQIAPGTVADLTEPEAQTLPDLIAGLRHWLGFAPAKIMLPIPNWGLTLVARAADFLGHLGWRPALRTTAMQALRDGVTGDPYAWQRAGGRPCRTLDETLRDMPATAQERLFSRAYFAAPLAIATLSLFWLLSGVITLFVPNTAIEVLTSRGGNPGFANLAVYGGAFADMALGALILWRPTARKAALGMIALSLAYLVGSVGFAPDLWIDPLGPMVKVLPAIALAALVALLLGER